jgi:hypothetical protein
VAPIAALRYAGSAYVWALLPARIYEVRRPLCPKCGGDMRIMAFITATAEELSMA